MDGVIIVSADTASLEQIAALERETFADPWSESDFAALIGNPNALFLAANVGERIAGYIVMLHAADAGEIANLAVASDLRRSGIGAALLDAALDFCRANGVVGAALEVRESNAPAQALYTSRGFAPIGRRRAYYRNPREDAIVMLRKTW